MERRRALLTYLVFGLAALVVMAVPWPAFSFMHRWSILPWAIAVGGPAAVVLLTGPLVDLRQPWSRFVAAALPAASLGFLVKDTLRSMALGIPSHLPALASPLAFNLMLAAIMVVALVPAWRRMDAQTRTLFWAFLAAAVAVAFLQPRFDWLILFVFTLQVGAVLGLAGFRRSGLRWLAAAGTAALVLLVGFLAVVAIHGSLVPLRVVLDAQASEALLLPVLGASALAFVVVLAPPRWRKDDDGDAAGS